MAGEDAPFEDAVLLGVVLGAHGLKGEVKVKSFTQSPAALGAYGPVTAGDGRQFRILSVRPAKSDELIAAFAGIPDRAAAASLKGQRLYVARSALPATPAGEFYHADLIGMSAVDQAGNHLGKLIAVHNFGAGDVIEIEAQDGETRFVAFNDEAVPVVDVAAGRIVVAHLHETQ